jgi:plastocyanin
MRLDPARPTALILLLAAVLGACQSADDHVLEREITPLDLGTVASLTGEVRFEGPIPQQSPLRITGFAECAAQHDGPLFAGDILITDGKLENALVYVKEGLGDRVFAVPDATVVIDQEACLFVPRVSGAQVGQPVRFLNSDPLSHNVHGVPSASSRWNFSLPVKGSSRTITVGTPENVIEIKCDVHPWMKAYLGVFDHPYFTVTASDGRFVLRNLPSGNYVVEAWHERFGIRSAAISLQPKESKQISFSFAAG